MKFRVGDTVERINESWDKMLIGDIDIVTSVSKYSIYLKNYKGGHDYKNFIKVKGKSLYKIY